MAQLKITLTGETIGEKTFTYNMDDADAGRILQWGAEHPQYGKVSEENEDGETVERDATPQEVVSAICDGFVNGTLAQIEKHEREKARKAAEANIAPLNVSKA